jgi:hypothetical protein
MSWDCLIVHSAPDAHRQLGSSTMRRAAMEIETRRCCRYVDVSALPARSPHLRVARIFFASAMTTWLRLICSQHCSIMRHPSDSSAQAVVGQERLMSGCRIGSGQACGGSVWVATERRMELTCHGNATGLRSRLSPSPWLHCLQRLSRFAGQLSQRSEAYRVRRNVWRWATVSG